MNQLISCTMQSIHTYKRHLPVPFIYCLIILFVQQEEKKRAALVARANQSQDEDLGWGDEGWCTPKESFLITLSK